MWGKGRAAMGTSLVWEELDVWDPLLFFNWVFNFVMIMNKNLIWAPQDIHVISMFVGAPPLVHHHHHHRIRHSVPVGAALGQPPPRGSCTLSSTFPFQPSTHYRSTLPLPPPSLVHYQLSTIPPPYPTFQTILFFIFHVTKIKHYSKLKYIPFCLWFSKINFFYFNIR